MNRKNYVKAQYVTGHTPGYHRAYATAPGKLDFSRHVTPNLTLQTGSFDFGTLGPSCCSGDAFQSTKMGIARSAGVGGMD